MHQHITVYSESVVRAPPPSPHSAPYATWSALTVYRGKIQQYHGEMINGTCLLETASLTCSVPCQDVPYEKFTMFVGRPTTTVNDAQHYTWLLNAEHGTIFKKLDTEFPVLPTGDAMFSTGAGGGFDSLRIGHPSNHLTFLFFSFDVDLMHGSESVSVPLNSYVPGYAIQMLEEPSSSSLTTIEFTGMSLQFCSVLQRQISSLGSNTDALHHVSLCLNTILINRQHCDDQTIVADLQHAQNVVLSCQRLIWRNLGGCPIDVANSVLNSPRVWLGEHRVEALLALSLAQRAVLVVHIDKDNGVNRHGLRHVFDYFTIRVMSCDVIRICCDGFKEAAITIDHKSRDFDKLSSAVYFDKPSSDGDDQVSGTMIEEGG